jgi:putative membrane protein
VRVLYARSVNVDETTDAIRRTRLANERTYLAWWRTGLTSIAVSVGLGRIVPGVSHVTKWPYELVGAGFGLLGIAFIAVGYGRVRSVERAVARGEYPRLDEGIELALNVAGIARGLATIALVVFA